MLFRSSTAALDGASGFDGAQAAWADVLSTDAGLSFDRSFDAADSVLDRPPQDALDSTDQGCTLPDDLPAVLPTIGFSAYHTLAQMSDYLRAVAAAVPNLARYETLGASKQGREIGHLVIDATCQARPPAILFNGAHHGDEPVSAEVVLALPDHFLRQGASDPSVRSLLQTYAFSILPVVNPDGLANGSRYNADGVDINRDYSFPRRADEESFKTVEARLIKSLHESMSFVGAIAFHSGSEQVLWPWCYTGSGTEDENFFLDAGKKTAAAMGFSVYQQSYDDYPTEGEYIDFAYAKYRTLAATVEVSASKTPSPAALASVVDRARKGAVAWVQAVSDRASGRLHTMPVPGPRPKFPFTSPFDGTQRLE